MSNENILLVKRFAKGVKMGRIFRFGLLVAAPIFTFSIARANPANMIPSRYTCGSLVEAVQYGDDATQIAINNGIDRELNDLRTLEVALHIAHPDPTMEFELKNAVVNAIYFACSNNEYPMDQPLWKTLPYAWISNLVSMQHISVTYNQLTDAVIAYLMRNNPSGG